MRPKFDFHWCFVCGVTLTFGIEGAFAQVAAPVFVPANADGVTPFDVTVTSATPGAEIRYTLNGFDPTPADLLLPVDGKIPVNRAITLKAKAWLGVDASTVTESTYSVTGAIGAGEIHSLSVSAAKALSAWGDQGAGRLGNGVTTSNALSPVASRYSAGSTITDAVGLATGADHSLFIKLNSTTGVRTVWGFGNNGAGELGNNATGAQSYAVQVVKSTTSSDYLTGIYEVAAGSNFSLAAHSDGSVYSWGTKTNGRLGDGGTFGNRKYADKVERGDTGTYPPLSGIVSVRARNGSAFAREACDFESSGASGRVWVWGLNTSGQLGFGTTTNQSRAVLMKQSGGTTLTDAWDVSAGELHAAVVRWRGGAQPIDRRVWCVGQQSSGRLGNGSTSSGTVSTPSANAVNKASNGQPLEKIISVAAGAAHTLALDEFGNVWSWGDNSTGALGDATTTNRSTAVQVKLPAAPPGGTPDLLQNIVAIAAGGTGSSGYSLAVAADGTVYGWGENGNGQLGIGNTTDSTRPKAISSFKLLAGYPEVGLAATVSPPGASGTVLLTATPTDPDGAGTIASVKFYVNGTLAAERTSSPWTYSYVPAGEGSYHAFALVTDATGITGQSPPASFSINTPQVSLAAEVAPSHAPGTVLLTASPTDADGAGDLASVKFYVNGALAGEATAPPWTCSHYPGVQGTFPAVAVVRDKFGLESSSPNVPFSVYAPHVTVALSPLLWEEPGYVTATASPTDADGAGNLQRVDFLLAGNVVATASSAPWAADLSGIAAGSHSLVAVAVDHFGFTGNSAGDTITIHPAEGATDTDGDGMPDWWETLYGMNPSDPSDAPQDWWGDGVSNLIKYRTGRNPYADIVDDTSGITGLQVHTPLE